MRIQTNNYESITFNLSILEVLNALPAEQHKRILSAFLVWCNQPNADLDIQAEDEPIMRALCSLQMLTGIEINNYPDVMNIDEVAQYLKVSKSRVYHLTRAKDIPFYRNGRYLTFKRAEIDEWRTMKEKQVPTTFTYRKQADKILAEIEKKHIMKRINKAL